MDRNMEVLIQNIIGDDESYQDGLEQNVQQHANTLWNVMGINKQYWYGKKLNGLQHESFAMKHDGRLSPSCKRMIEDVDRAL